MVSGLNEAQVLDVSSQREFSERQSDRSEVDLVREKHTPQTVDQLRRREQACNMAWLAFMGWEFHRLMSGRVIGLP